MTENIKDREYDVLDLLDDIENGRVQHDRTKESDKMASKTRKKIKEKEEVDELDRIRQTANDNFSEGQTVKYKRLCEILGIPYKTGATRYTQLKQLSRVIELEKKGTSYLIKKIHGDVQDKPPREIRRDSVYTKIIQILLLLFLSGEYGMSAIHTQREWWEILGMVNQKYNFLRVNKNKESRMELLALTDDMTMEDINIFYEESGAKFMSVFNKALDRLENASIIHVDHTYIVRHKSSDGFFPIEIEVSLTNEARVLESDRRILNEHGMYDFYELWQLTKEEREMIYKEIYEKREEITGGKTYNAIKIKYVKDKTVMGEYIKWTIDDLKKELNSRCRAAYQKRLDRKCMMVMEKLKKEEGNEELMTRFYEKQSLLADRLISIER